jgi:hypothetical protein
MHLTPEMAEASYNLLLTTPPFRGWKLPPSDEVSFHITAHKGQRGDYYQDENRRHVIRISYRCVTQLDTLMRTMAHEMCHIQEARICRRWDVEHSSTFNRLADRVCKIHPFDRGTF